MPVASGKPDVPARVAATGAFVGRESELASLVARLTARDGVRRGTVLEGEPGIGKSRLVTEALTLLPAGVCVLRGRGDPLQRERPFGAVTEAMSSVVDPASDAAPSNGASHPDEVLRTRIAPGHQLRERVTTGSDPFGPASSEPTSARVGPGRRAQLVDDLVASIVDAARVGPVVVAIEDLQWVDAGSLAVLHELLELGPGPDVAVVGTRRRGPGSPGWCELVARLVPRKLEVVELAPLADEDVRELVTALVGRPPGPGLADHVAGAAGNPLFIRELLDALGEQGSLVATGGEAGASVEVVRASLPPSLRLTVLQRLSTLAQPALDTLLLAATLGTTFDPADLAVVLDEPATSVVARLGDALRAGWIEARGPHLAFRHDVVRDAIHDDAAPAIRRALHRQVADRLLAAGRSPATVASHLLLGCAAPDPEAARWLHTAGRDALASAPQSAVELLRGAAELDPAPSAWRDEVLLDLGVASMWAGAVDEGERTLRDLLERPHHPDVDADARLALARSCILAGRSDEAVALLRAPGPLPGPSIARTRLDAELALTSMLRGELDEAATLTDAVLAASDELRTDETWCLASSVRAALLAMAGRFDEATRTARAAVDLATTSPHREASRRPPQLFLGSVLIDSDRFDEGWRALHAGRRVSEELGTVWDLPVQHLVAARGRFLAGDHADVVAEVETALAAADDTGTRVLEVWGHAMLAHVALHRGDHVAARSSIEAGEAAVARTGPQVRGTDWLLWARARLDAAEDRHDAARTLLGLVWDAHGTLGMRSERRLLGPDLTELHLAAADRAAATDVVSAVEANAEVAGTASARAVALRCRGRVEDDPDRLLQAVEVIGRTDCRMEHVLTALDAGTSLAGHGRAREAVDVLEDARALAGACGMLAAVRRTDGALRALGVRRGAAGERDRPVTGWASLTPTEVTVTRLAAEGLTNPEIGERLFVSRRTVQTHLSHVFAKLQVGSRVELASLVARSDTRQRPADPGGGGG